MAAQEAAPELALGWDEVQCIAALAKLEHLQAHLHDLRLTIHRVVQPLEAPAINTVALFAAYKDATLGSQDRLKSFSAQWQSEEIQSIFQHTKESLKANPDLSACAQVPRYGWQKVASKGSEDKRPRKGQKIEEAPVSLDTKQFVQIVEDFCKAHPRLKVAMKDDNRDFMIEFVARGAKFKFNVVLNQTANGRDKLSAKCLAPTSLSKVISRCISSRPHANDLRQLLEMIAAYKEINGDTCAKCDRTLDRDGLDTTARRSKQTTTESGSTETIWEAFHAGCVD